MSEKAAPHVALLVTCLVDLYRPGIAFASLRLLEQAGCRVSVPKAQTCCGQPNYNSGDRSGAADLAKRTVAIFEPYEYVVVPSGSCAGMLHRHYPALLHDDPDWHPRAEALAEKSHELTSFLTAVMRFNPAGATHKSCAAYHDGCSGLRELGIKAAPRRLLESVEGLTFGEMAETERCCGFGGLFSVKFDAVAQTMGERKLDAAEACGADEIIAGELGCLLHMAGLALRRGRRIRCRHIAEVLADMGGRPAIGEDA